jgi:hypothetical protein
MTMKRTELEKRAGMQIRNRLRGVEVPDRYGKGAAAPADRRAQRERERALGLVPFAVKLPADLIKALDEEARRRSVPVAELTAELLRKAL